MSTRELTAWHDLRSQRRQELLLAIESTYSSEDKFGTSDLNRVLDDDKPTTTPTLNKLDKEDGYIKRVHTGGFPILVAQITGDEDQVAVGPDKQEKLARQMVNREGLPITPEEYAWAVDQQRNAFAAEFNKRASGVRLNPTWSRNLYSLTDEGKRMIQTYKEN